MKLFNVSIKITRAGYVKDGDELVRHQEAAHAIVANALAQMRAELAEAGYLSEVKTEGME